MRASESTHRLQADALIDRTHDSGGRPTSTADLGLGFLRPPKQPDEIGRLGPYRVLAILGQGGMGLVFRAIDPKLNRPVALKVLRPELAGREAMLRFVREARAAAAVEHDHVVPIYQVGEDAGTPYLAMPLLKGQSLQAALAARPQTPVPELLRVGRQIADGLSAAHAAGLIHRDIKPANVWLEGAGRRVKILDFGIARAAGTDDPAAVDSPSPAAVGATRTGSVMGTPAYMPPEQAVGQAVDHRADLYSLGVVLYQMATGRVPFLGDDPTAVLVAAATEPPMPPDELRAEIPAPLNALVLRLLGKTPAERPATAAAVSAELRAIELGLAAAAATEAVDPWQVLAEQPTDTMEGTARTPAGDRPSCCGRSPGWR